MNVVVGSQRWLVRHDAAFWFPAGVTHAVEPLSEGTTYSVYGSVRLRPPGERWDAPRAITISPLMGELIRHLSTGEPSDLARASSHGLLSALVQEAADERSSLVLPSHRAARAIAERVLSDPGADLPLARAAAEAGVSTRTVMRAFVTETGLGYAPWRTRARLIASLNLLAAGTPVGDVAPRVGYATASGFISAFRSAFGTTPAEYARRQR